MVFRYSLRYGGHLSILSVCLPMEIGHLEVMSIYFASKLAMRTYKHNETIVGRRVFGFTISVGARGGIYSEI